MAQLPADRTKLALAQSNQVPSAVASSQRNKDAITEAYDTIDQLYQFANDLISNGTYTKRNEPINILYPPTPLSPVKADGTDPLGDTNNLQAIINYAIANKRDVYVPKDLILQPILQSDGSRVCLKFDDGATNGNTRTPFKIFAKKGTRISTNNTTQLHTILRWKLGDSIIEGFNFVGTRAYTTGLEMSRINLTNTAEFDVSSRNHFSDLRFYNCNNAITMEGSVYYNTFDNVNFYETNLCLWLKKTYALINGLIAFDSGVNRNNFYSLSAFGCTDGVKLDYGDTNKFYSLSFEWLSGTSVQVYDQSATPGLQQTVYNTFYGVTNEQCGMNLIYNAPYGNSFIDFESPYAKATFTQQPTVYIPSGDALNNHLFLQSMKQTNDQNVLKYLKNRNYIGDYHTYVSNISDYSGTDANGVLRGFSWRNFPFTTAQCTNVASIVFNSPNKAAIFKSVGGVVFYYAKFSFIPTSATSSITIPLPELGADSDIYGFGINVSGVIPIGYLKDGANPVMLAATINATGITIPAPSGGWSATAGNSANVLLINLHYARTFPVGNFIDTN